MPSSGRRWPHFRGPPRPWKPARSPSEVRPACLMAAPHWMQCTTEATPRRVMVRATVVTGGSPRHPAPGRRMMVAMKPPRAETRRYLPSSPFKPPAPAPPAETFAVHDQVTHDKYGLGIILGVEDGIAVLVDFGPQRLRIPVPCAKLTKL